MYTYPGAASVPGPTTSTWGEVLANGASNDGISPFIEAGSEIVIDTGGVSPASIGADGPTVRMRNPDGQWRIQAPVTAAGGQIALQIEDLAAAVLWRMISFAAAATVLNEEWRSGGALGNFRIGPDPVFPDSYHGAFAVEDDYIFNTDGSDPTAYVNFYTGSRVSWGEFSAGRDQELEGVLTIMQFFAPWDGGGGTSEWRLTPPAAANGRWEERLGTAVAGLDLRSAQGDTLAPLRLRTLGANGASASMFTGTRNPEGNVTADRGSLYLRDDATGGAIYRKQTTALNTGWLLIADEFSYGESEGTSTTPVGDTTYQLKLTLTTPASSRGGTYVVEWYAELQAVTAGMAQMRVTIDGTVAAEPTEDLLADFSSHGGVRRVAMAAGARTITIEFRTTLVTGSANIRRARIHVYREASL